VAFCYQKLRKENGAIMTIIQSPAQLPDNEYTKGIISNTQILYVLPTTNVVYSDVEEMFRFDSKAKKNLMRSIKNDFASKRKYSEVFISFGDKDFKVLRLELSPEKFLAFQTDGSIWQELQDRAKSTDILTAIQTMLS
jgi:conjugation system ATPase, TraG family